jgi:beta-phosphoglucomutase-like phosphatase (HAD superfamily)
VAASLCALWRRPSVSVELRNCKSGLMPYFEGRIFSGHELPRSKPAPDVFYLAAAAVTRPEALRRG